MCPKWTMDKFRNMSGGPLKMKKLLILLLLLPIVIAQENLEISLIEYIPDTNRARVQIENTLPNDLNNVKFQIDIYLQFHILRLLHKLLGECNLMSVEG